MSDDLALICDALQRATDAALAADEVPVAACVVVNGELVSVAHNACVGSHDPTAHAEILALRRAGAALANYRLTEATLYVTLEPCVMCAGAIANARVRRVVYGLPDEKAGACGSVTDAFANNPVAGHLRAVTQNDQIAQIARSAFTQFFAHKRSRPKMPAYSIFDAKWSDAAARAEMAKIRFDVFVREQDVPAELELDANDALSHHAVARMNKDGAAIATGRLLPDGHIGRMAVLKAYRGTGVGMAILQHLQNVARAQGFTEALLSAQTHAIPFYEKAGFIAFGDEYLDCDIPHRMMRVAL